MTTQAPLSPYITFLEESLLFQVSLGYILAAEIAARDHPEEEIGRTYANLTKKLKTPFGAPRFYFNAKLFISYISVFEVFLQDSVSLILHKNPLKAGTVEFRLSEILESSGHDELIDRATETTLNRIMYKKPKEYLYEVCSLLSIEHDDLISDWNVFVEAKARRDLGVHNSWKCNSVYVRKISEVGMPQDIKLGASAAPIDPGYLKNVATTVERLAETINRRVIEKHWPDQLSELDA